MDNYFVYILADRTRRIYVGMTNNLARRITEHKNAEVPGFTQRYRIDQLVYLETFPRPRDAIEREKEIKGWRREKKIALIESVNPGWADLGVPQ